MNSEVVVRHVQIRDEWRDPPCVRRYTPRSLNRLEKYE